MGTLVEDFLASDEYSESTKGSYRRILNKLVLAKNLAEFTASDLLNFVKENVNGDEHHNTQRYVALCACRSFLSWRYGQVHPARSARIKRVLPKKQRALTMSQIVELLASFDTSTAIGARDLALAAVAIDTGLRRSELARVRLEDVDLQNLNLQVIVKGGQWGTGLYSPQTAVFIESWLNFRKPAKGVNTLFISLRGSPNHKGYGQALTGHGIKMIFRKWSRNLSFEFTPHDARRTFATVTHLLQAPTKAAMAAGRWNNMEVYEKYLIDVAAEQIRPFLPIQNAIKLQKQNL